MAGMENKEHPLAGVVLCFTSILPEQRSELAAIAGQMGATHKFDLTSDVTHLLVGDTNTPKYKYVARERSDVTVLIPEWIEAVRQSWMQGGDTNLLALEEQYKLPTFYGLAICITGFEDVTLRNYIQEAVIANGADFRKDLTKNVTHLIAREANGQKYKFATQWNIKIVSMKWFSESLERGMILEESLYQPLVPIEKQGIGAWVRCISPAPAKQEAPGSVSDLRPRKLRRIASAKLGGQNEGIWNDIVGKPFDNIEHLDSDNNESNADDQSSAKMRPAIQDTRSFASETTVAGRQDFSHSNENRLLGHHGGFLQNCNFLVHGFSPKQMDVLRHHLQFNGAHIIDSFGEKLNHSTPASQSFYAIVPYKMPRSEIPFAEDIVVECKIVTDMWLERCLDAKAMVPPESHVTSTPFPQFPIPDFQEMHICSTGFSGLDLLHLSKLVNIMGATYDEYLTPNASVLICNDPNSVNPEKLRHTFGWGIPTVSADWLWISIQAGYKKPFESYLLQRLQSQIENCKTECRDKLVQPQSVERKRAIESEPPEDNADSRQTGGSARSPSDRKGAPEDVATNKESDPILKESRPNLPTNDPYGSLGSPSPTKDQGELGVPLERRESSESRLSNSTSAASKALDLAVSGLLKKARARSHLSLIASDTSNERPQPKRRKPLLGRAGSLSSTNAFGRQGASRASSIDSLNGDGCEDSIDGLDMEPSHNNTSRNNLNGQSFHSVLSAGNLSIYGELPPDDTEYRAEREAEVEDQEVLLMTQLNYEDPDAVAMRQEFMRRAGKPENKEPGPRTLVLGELKDLDVSRGWRPGRRTRKARKTTEVEDNLF